MARITVNCDIRVVSDWLFALGLEPCYGTERIYPKYFNGFTRQVQQLLIMMSSQVNGFKCEVSNSASYFHIDGIGSLFTSTSLDQA